jgi:hypothetical protein
MARAVGTATRSLLAVTRVGDRGLVPLASPGRARRHRTGTPRSPGGRVTGVGVCPGTDDQSFVLVNTTFKAPVSAGFAKTSYAASISSSGNR